MRLKSRYNDQHRYQSSGIVIDFMNWFCWHLLYDSNKFCVTTKEKKNPNKQNTHNSGVVNELQSKYGASNKFHQKSQERLDQGLDGPVGGAPPLKPLL